MKVLICGPRVWKEPRPIVDVIRELPQGTIVVHGGARGVDSIAGYVAKRLGLEVRAYPVDHALDGPWPAAGPRRNIRMLTSEHPCRQDGCFIDVGIAFKLQEEISKGTGHMARTMRAVRDPKIVVRELLWRDGRLTE